MKAQNLPSLLEEFPAPGADDWRRAAEESLDGAPFEKKLITHTPEGIELQPIYTAAEGDPVTGDWPGLAPYGRGSTALGARTKGWLICQELPYGRPEEFNAATYFVDRHIAEGLTTGGNGQLGGDRASVRNRRSASRTGGKDYPCKDDGGD